MKKGKSLMVFPCEFPIKIMGNNCSAFESEIVDIVLKHFPETKEHAIKSKQSQQGNYLAISITLYICDQQTLDKLYNELTKHPEVKMVL